MKFTFPALVNMISRVVAILVSIVATSIAYDYLGVRNFGIWSVLTSFIFVFAAFGDGGIAQGMITITARLKEQKDGRGLKEALTSAFAVCFPLAICIAALGTIMILVVGVDRIIGKTNEEVLKISQFTAFVVLLGLLLNIFGNLTTNIRHGLGQLVHTSAWNVFGSLVVIPSVWLAAHLDAGMPGIAAAILFPPLLIRLFVHGFYIVKTNELRPKWSYLNHKMTRMVLKGGGAFLAIAISQGLAQHSDQIIISHFKGPEAVTPYALMNRLFLLPSFLATSVFYALWPKLSAGFASNDLTAIRKNFWISFSALSVAGFLATLMIFCNLDFIFQLWLGNVPNYPPVLPIGFALYSFIVIPVSALLLLIISAQNLKFQLWASGCMTVTNIILTLLLVPAIGSAGAIFATVIAYVACLLIPGCVTAIKILK